MEQFDCIIVGAGSAGCVLAARLSADGRRRVLLLEAGGGDRRFWIKAPIGYGKSYFDRRVNWSYHTEPDPGTGDRSAYWPRGKLLGGSSSINAMVYCRGLPGDFDDWRAAGNPGWGWHDVRPIFESFERRVAADGSARGDGPLWVSDREAEYHPIRRYFYEAAREIGLPFATDMNGPDPEGVGAYAINTRRGLRCSAADAFLRPALGRKNLCVRLNALVERVRFEGRRAIGVEYRAGTDSHFARAGEQVIVAAGAVNSPQILQLSGIGPGNVLRAAGVAVRHANDAVGGGLQDHLGINYSYRATEPTLNQTLGTWRGRIACGLRYLAWRAGPLSLGVNQMGGLVRSSPQAPRPDLQLYFNPLSYSISHADKRPLLSPDSWPGFIMAFNACRPTSTGRIEIAAPDPARPPRIHPNYLDTAGDIAEAIAGARLIGRLQDTSAMGRLIAAPPGFDVARASDDEIVADFRARSGTVFHPCGTCRMAPESERGVVDASLRVHGVDGLRVVDASIFPEHHLRQHQRADHHGRPQGGPADRRCMKRSRL
ncbi:MAG: GMC family oxidoreductase [Dongiaceae bacterium]